MNLSLRRRSVHWAPEWRMGCNFAYDRFTSLDHALWVHRFIPWDDWWLLKAYSQVSSGGRALSRRELYTRDGVLLASAAQEALIASATG